MRSDPGGRCGATASPAARRATRSARESTGCSPRPARPAGDVLLFAHGHLLRVLTARWLGLEPAEGRLFALDPATLSILGYERETSVIRLWNEPV